MGEIHAVRGERAAQQFAVPVVADPPDDPGPAAEPRRRDRLVGALPARMDDHVGPEHGLPGAGLRSTPITRSALTDPTTTTSQLSLTV